MVDERPRWIFIAMVGKFDLPFIPHGWLYQDNQQPLRLVSPKLPA